MNRIWLAANGGNGVLQPLLSCSEISLDRVKVGSWMDDATLIVTAATHPVLLHVTEGIAWPRTGRWIAEQTALVDSLRSPWVSAHLELGSHRLNYHWPRFSLIPTGLSHLDFAKVA